MIPRWLAPRLFTSPPTTLLRTPKSAITAAIPTCTRSVHHSRKIPAAPEPPVAEPEAVTHFLTSIGRNLIQFAPKFTSWSHLMTAQSTELKALGLEPPRLRKYLLHWRHRYVSGQKLQEFTKGKVVDGGERRQKMVRAKRRVDENKDRKRAEDAARIMQ